MGEGIAPTTLLTRLVSSGRCSIETQTVVVWAWWQSRRSGVQLPSASPEALLKSYLPSGELPGIPVDPSPLGDIFAVRQPVKYAERLVMQRISLTLGQGVPRVLGHDNHGGPAVIGASSQILSAQLVSEGGAYSLGLISRYPID